MELLKYSWSRYLVVRGWTNDNDNESDIQPTLKIKT